MHVYIYVYICTHTHTHTHTTHIKYYNVMWATFHPSHPTPIIHTDLRYLLVVHKKWWSYVWISLHWLVTGIKKKKEASCSSGFVTVYISFTQSVVEHLIWINAGFWIEFMFDEKCFMYIQLYAQSECKSDGLFVGWCDRKFHHLIQM